MKKIVIASALMALLTTNLSVAGNGNGFYKHPQYPHHLHLMQI